MITITLARIRLHNPCETGWMKLLRFQGKVTSDDEEFPLSEVLKSNGLAATVWCFRCIPEHYQVAQRFAVWCGHKIRPLMEDQRSRTALEVAEKYLAGEATKEEWEKATREAGEVPASLGESNTEANCARLAACYIARIVRVPTIHYLTYSVAAATLVSYVEVEEKLRSILKESQNENV